ncbi:DUF3501 family protein [Beggiatoa leptomitoformis]|uniref:DUF3501 family protein n=1 Tax=Beggiatoa leptomitoformis TaxID=288004 RepID=A0A650GE86_9GAMM|nr:DUF3501 family protein [Beggiatoa leptomitoformis]ALG68777.1 DUF3501 family protein [Beggiatoa leptomitoformis]QGX04129.1 DUF3501 family protein [Beggiatoa leptomitoformis]
MKKLCRDDLFSLEKYAAVRPQFRTEVMVHKKQRQVALGEHVTLFFEDRLTIQYQIQEMLRAERIYEAEGIDAELSAYNPLIPDGTNWKATLMLEYTDVEERKRALMQLKGIQEKIWVQVAGQTKIYPIANEDMERENQEKTAAVHFLRFELDMESQLAVKAGKAIAMGVDHVAYQASINPIAETTRMALVVDLQ